MSEHYDQYMLRLAELAHLRESGDATDEVKNQYADALNELWWKMGRDERAKVVLLYREGE